MINLVNWFPKLKSDPHFSITSPLTDVYNCIAFAMGTQEMWIACANPNGTFAWWPPTVERTMNPQSLINAFAYMGFQQCDNPLPEEGYDKVVLYKTFAEDIQEYEWTHAAKVFSDNELHSKVGSYKDIHHRDGDIFEGTDYGQEYAYMKRPIADRHLTQDRLPSSCDVIIQGQRHHIIYNGAHVLSDTIIA